MKNIFPSLTSALVQTCLKLAKYSGQQFLMNLDWSPFPANKYMFKVDNRNTRKRYETCSTLTITTIERRHWRRYGVFIVNLEYIPHFFQVFLLLTWTGIFWAEAVKIFLWLTLDTLSSLYTYEVFLLVLLSIIHWYAYNSSSKTPE